MESTSGNTGEVKLNVKRGRKRRAAQCDHKAKLNVSDAPDKVAETSMEVDNIESSTADQLSNTRMEKNDRKSALDETSMLAGEIGEQAADDTKVLSTTEMETFESMTQSLGCVEIPIDVQLAAEFEDACGDSLCDISMNTIYDVLTGKDFDTSTKIVNDNEKPEKVTAILYDAIEKEGGFAESLPVGGLKRDSISENEGKETEDVMETETSEPMAFQNATGQAMSDVEQISDTACQGENQNNTSGSTAETKDAQDGYNETVEGVKDNKTNEDGIEMGDSEQSGQTSSSVQQKSQTNNVEVKKVGRGRPKGSGKKKEDPKSQASHEEICEELRNVLPQEGESKFSKEGSKKVREILMARKKLPCPKEGCGRFFKNFAGFEYHVVRCGDASVSFRCELCELVYKSSEGLKYHKKWTHSMQDEGTTGESEAVKQPSSSKSSERQRIQPVRSSRTKKQPLNDQDEEPDDDATIESNDANSSSDESEKNVNVRSKTWMKYYEEVKDETAEPVDREQCAELSNMSEISAAIKKKSRVKCPKKCGRSYRIARRLYHHLKECEGKSTKHRCTLCGKILLSKTGMRFHIILKHRKKQHNSENSEESEFSEGEKPGYVNVNRSAAKDVFRSQSTDFVEKTKAWYEAFHGETVLTCWRPSLKHWKKLSESDAKHYLPVRKKSPVFRIEPVSTKKNSRPEQNIDCQLPLFSSAPVNSVGGLCSITFNVGGPVWAMDWAPVPIDAENCDQYLAIGCHRDPEKLHLLSECYKEKGVLEIWRIPKLQNGQRPTEQPEFSLGIAHDYGPLWDIRWCPSGAWDRQNTEESELRRLGLLALACADGKVRIFSVPFPGSLLKHFGDDSGKTPDEFIFRAIPHAELSPGSRCRTYQEECGAAWVLSWQPINGHDKVVASYADGTVAIWHLKTDNRVLKATTSDGLTDSIFPVSHFQAHNSVIRSLAWCPSEPNYIATGSYDKSIKIWDIRHTSQPVGYFKGLSYNITWPIHWPLLLYNTDCENRIRGTRCFDYHSSSRNDRCIGHVSYCYIPHNATAWDNDYSHWTNVVVSVDAAGVLAMSFMNSGFHQKRSSSKTPIFRALYEPAVQCEVGHNSDQSVQSESIEDNQEKRESYKLVFMDAHPLSVTRAETELMLNDKGCVPPDKPTYSALQKVRWNPNFSSYYWLATAGQAGLVRLCYVYKFK